MQLNSSLAAAEMRNMESGEKPGESVTVKLPLRKISQIRAGETVLLPEPESRDMDFARAFPPEGRAFLFCHAR